MSNSKIVVFLLGFAIIICAIDNFNAKNRLGSLESRLTKLEIRVDKLCAGKC